MSEIINVINQFLHDQRADFLDKKVAQETRDKRAKYNQFLEKSKNTESDNEKLAQEKQKLDEAISKAVAKFQPEADSKYEINRWFYDVSSKARPNVTTHPAKFTNPKVKDASSFLFYGEHKDDGYLKTGNARLEVKVDVSGNAATNTLIFELYTLLEIALKDGSQLIDIFLNDSVEIIEFIEKINIEYDKFKDLCLSVFYGEDRQQATHELIRQVYFPVQAESEDYHLLSVVTPSMLLFEVKNRIDGFNHKFEGLPIRALKKDNKFHPDGFDEVFGLTEIGFSHNEFTKMGNVSYLNVRNKGIAYLLPSIPSEIKWREIRLPKQDFFRNSLRIKKFEESFQTLHNLIGLEVNNVHIRDGIRNTLKFIIDQVLQSAFKIRAYDVGWSNRTHYLSLPLAQRIWLDDAYFEQRESQHDWIDEIAGSFGHWIIHAYEYSFKDIHIKLSDDELKHIRGVAEEAISSDREFFK
ncbi:type I-F CRISPR-associated protein Csy1 [Methylomicrobium lacus]|uniref:type I-F CRISPR-associated protein Csy1 n=1 Tax=Methylomicrobium lacus TaxID=136992 RepID=UPI0035A9719A